MEYQERSIEEYILTGTVVRGKGLGRTQGMPTANLKIPEGSVLPPDGVYGGMVTLTAADGSSEIFEGLTNIGTRPSVDDSPEKTVETMILGLDRDLYGQTLTLRLQLRIRDIRKFPGGLEEVRQQIDRDILTWKAFEKAQKEKA